MSFDAVEIPLHAFRNCLHTNRPSWGVAGPAEKEHGARVLGITTHYASASSKPHSRMRSHPHENMRLRERWEEAVVGDRGFALGPPCMHGCPYAPCVEGPRT